MIEVEQAAESGVERRWIRVARCESIPPREGRAAVINGKEIAIFNLGDRFLAVDNRCPHQSGPLCDGIVAGDAVVCPLHAWKVNLVTGTVMRPVNQNECVHAYATRVDGGVISIEA
jgi:nitrite reductase (NADH) small subunit